jgi:hypothetical protein
MISPRRAPAVGLALGLTILGVTLASSMRVDAMADFRAFWCGGVAIAQHANPYLQQPLQRCEQLAGPPWEGPALAQVALPAPLPPFALLAYAALSPLPFPVAIAIYGLALAAAITVAIELLARVTGVPTLAVAVVIAPIAWSDAVMRGQPFAFVLLALAAAAFFLQRSQPRVAALCLLGTAVQPHVALPAILGALVLVPRMRLPLVAGSAALGLLSVAATGLAVTVSYLRDVLPAHAVANAYEWQFSLTSLLTSAGVAVRTAIAAGSVTYGLMTLLGIVVAVVFVHRDGDLVPAVLIPPAFAVFLGVHVHYHQLALAFPAMLYVFVRSERWRPLAASALVVAMLPWDTIVVPALVAVWCVLAFAFGRYAFGPRAAMPIAAGTAAFAAAVTIVAFLHPALGAGAPPFVAHPYPAGALAEASWADYSRQELSRASPLLFALRAPTIVGIALGLAAVAGAAFAPHVAMRRTGRGTSLAEA